MMHLFFQNIGYCLRKLSGVISADNVLANISIEEVKIGRYYAMES